jgi:hypothetical protein
MNSSSDSNGANSIDRNSSIQALYRSQNNPSNRKSFNAGQDYEAEVLSRSTDNSLNVRIGSESFRIQLGDFIAAGQTLTLRYLNSNPDPTFLLINSELPSTNQIDKTELSQAAQDIAQFMYEDQNDRLKTVAYQNTSALSNNPEMARLTAGNLKQEIDNSGLFYESHLADFIEGKRALSLMMEEPQNKLGFDPSMLVVKQLEILAQNKLHWSGEVWPQQNMDWTTLIEKRPEPRHTNDDGNNQQNNQTTITSILKFNFSNLGTLKATVQINQDRMQIKFETDGAKSSQVLKSQTNVLTLALQSLGQKIDTISVGSS